MENLEKYLFEAVGKEKNKISLSNPYREIGFDREKNRLGWLKVYHFGKIKEKLEALTKLILDKECFIFVGMGGSINGIKALLNIFRCKNIFAIDSLAPEALMELKNKIKSFDKTLIVSISKSATTLETQLISLTLKEIFVDRWQEHFLWLTDQEGFAKLDLEGWKNVKRIPIQFDEDNDIGGRFSCPNTLIFFLPLFLLLKKDFLKLEKIYTQYISLQTKIRKIAYNFAKKCSKSKYAYFQPIVDKKLNHSLDSWVIQLFQESLGSKDNLNVKTLIEDKKIKGFLPFYLNLKIKNKVTLLMASMYFFEIFIAYYSAFKKINFVTQDFVEKYKEKMKEIFSKKESLLTTLSIQDVIDKIKNKINKKFRFIEVVFFGYIDKKLLGQLKYKFKKVFPDKIIFVFVGSDWNHHSYQAAFADKNTFYVFLIPSTFNTDIPTFKRDTLEKNIHTLKIICKATYITLKDKSVLFSVSDI
ncbi:MAG: hypothetical protein NC935_03625 [Candidatus Omnitrophica bacterium]|nr:hypothetical protein [Candidatus Omnitrophota bacterium]